MEWNVLVRNGVLQLQDPGPPLLFLRSQLPGAYTTTRSSDNASRILFWDRHVERLAQSIEILANEKPCGFSIDPAKFPCFVDYLKSLLQRSLQIGLQRALELRSEYEELLIMAYIPGELDKCTEQEQTTCKGLDKINTQDHEGLEVYVHISRFLPPLSEASNPIRVAIMGFGRIVPNAKHTDWIKARKALEKARPEGVMEIILSNDGDLLLEGMVTNFFVVSNRVNTGVKVPLTEDKRWKGVVLQTAPLKGVLPGVIRKLILEICDEHGIPCEQTSPSWQGRESWTEAFTTNSVRLIQSISSIQGSPVHRDGTNEPHYWQQDSWEYLSLQVYVSCMHIVSIQVSC
ncbi:hypothetical protein KP509_25G054700 [Ceratopteris richardii]|uniref:Class IV aminotransferase n=1 Tax=Ceratopteris richardii TaxID=49495 RepID=A0A8T2RQD3_CERRI|nr:hypothetical protein KP509_25G054700 [Ceratopteris richardii]